ncbi:MAG: tetratricopeptide repeat protein [Thermoplasmatota archaeon]
MKMDKESLVLYSIYLVSRDPDDSFTYTRKHISQALNITQNTLDRTYISGLKNKGYLEIRKKMYTGGEIRDITITEDGIKRIKEIEEKLSGMTLTPENHNIQTYVKITQILKIIRNPLDRIFFLAVHNRYSSFDLMILLEEFRIRNSELSIINLARDLENPGEMGRRAFVDYFIDMSFYGSLDFNQDDLSNSESIDALLLRAESFRKQGDKIGKAREIYEWILSNPEYIDQNQWFVANIGLAHTVRKMGDTDHAFEILDGIIESTDNKYYIAYTKEIKAYIYSQMNEFGKSLELFRSSISAFNNFGFSLLLALGYNNRGILYFKMDDFKQAESDWKRARKYAREANSRYIEAITIGNLADIYMKKGKLDKSKGLLDQAEELFQSLKDMDKIASIEFNRALLYVEQKDLDKALHHFTLSETIAQPLPSPPERRERREEFIKRGLEKGFDHIENYLNPCDKNMS